VAFGLPALSAAAAQPAPVAIPLQTQFDYFGNNGLPVIKVVIGHDRPVNLLLDTASVGIRVLADDLPAKAQSGITLSTKPDRIGFIDGTEMTGVVARARVRIGGMATPPIPFEYVRSVACKTPDLHCPTSSPSGQKIDGVLGASMLAPTVQDPPKNPLSSLPGVYGLTWTIKYGQALDGVNSGAIVVGAPIPRRPLTVIRLKSAGRSSSRARYWDDDYAPLCWTFGSPSRYCGPTSFDSGSDLMVIQSDPLPAELGTTNTQLVTLRSGITMSAFLPSATRSFWSFDTGTIPDLNAVQAMVARPAFIDSGVQAFYSMNFTYDSSLGVITISSK